MQQSKTSGLALIASKEQQDGTMIDVSHYTLPHRQIRAYTSTQSQASSHNQQSIQGEDESFWWKRLDILTTVAANAPRLEDSGKTEPSQPTHARIVALRPQAQRIGAEEHNGYLTGAQMLTIRANSDYMRVLRNDPNLMFDVYDVQPVVPGRWTYALPENAARARRLCTKNKVPIEATTLRNLAIQAAELGINNPVTTHAFLERFGRIITPDILRHDLHIHIIFISRDHPLCATHQINLSASYTNALNQVMTLPANYPAAPRATYASSHHSPVLPTPPSATHSLHLAGEPTSPTKKSNDKEWKPSKDCPGLTCPRKEEYKKFVLECDFNGYGKYIDRFQNKLPAEYIDHLCTHNMALKWQQQCRRREIAKGATKYGEVERGGPRYEHDAIHFLGVWWLCFQGHYHKDDLSTEFNNTFPDQKRDKEALLAQANRVAAKIKATESRAGTHFATRKDDPAYIDNLRRWRVIFLPRWKIDNDVDEPPITQELSQSKPQSSKKRKEPELDNDTNEDEQDEQNTETSRLKYRRKDRA